MVQCFMDGCMHGWMDACMDGWMDEWMENLPQCVISLRQIMCRIPVWLNWYSEYLFEWTDILTGCQPDYGWFWDAISFWLVVNQIIIWFWCAISFWLVVNHIMAGFSVLSVSDWLSTTLWLVLVCHQFSDWLSARLWLVLMCHQFPTGCLTRPNAAPFESAARGDTPPLPPPPSLRHWIHKINV